LTSTDTGHESGVSFDQAAESCLVTLVYPGSEIDGVTHEHMIVPEMRLKPYQYCPVDWLPENLFAGHGRMTSCHIGAYTGRCGNAIQWR
jgi:hypothetical protein